MNDIETAKKLLFEGLDFLDAGDLENAESRLLEAARLAPQNNSVVTNLATVFAKQSKFPEARIHARKALAGNDRNIEALLVLSACCLHDSDKQFDEILNINERIIDIEPGNSDAHNNRGLALAHYARFTEAIESYDRAISLNPNDASYLTNRANALLRLKRYAEALASYDKALALKPDITAAWLGRGSALFELNRNDDALACFKKAAEFTPTSAPAWIAIGKLYQRLNQHDLAVAAYKKASEADPQDRHGARLLLTQPGAEELSGMTNDNETAKKLFFEGLDYFNAGDLENAELKLREAARLAPQNNSATTNLAVVLVKQRKFPEARMQARKALVDHERNIEALRVLSACCLADTTRPFDELLSLSDKIIDIEPGDSDAHNNHGLALMYYGRFAEALESYDRALAFKPNDAYSFTNRGNALFELKRHSEALAAHDKALTFKPDMAEGWLGRGTALVALNRNEEALASFEKAVAFDPDLTVAWLALGKLHQKFNRRNLAIAAYKKASEIDPEDIYGAKLLLARMGAEELSGMSPTFVRSLFDQYAPRFEKQLIGDLNYRGPQILLEAVLKVCRAAGHSAFFKRAIDLGCGTGLVARAFKPNVGELIGIDLSPGMIEHARKSGLYSQLHVADAVQGLAGEPEASADLILAADVLVYIQDLTPLIVELARVLRPGGMIAFTAEAHNGDGVILGAGMRYAQSAGYIRKAIAQAGLVLCDLTSASARNESGVPVPGLVAVARKA